MKKRNYMVLNPTPRDNEYVEAYRKFGTQKDAAEYCGVSRETIARACRRNSVRMDGRKLNGHGNRKNGTPPKITDKQLMDEIGNGLPLAKIAKNHDMSFERVYMRARRLGLPTDSSGGHYYKRVKFYGDADFDKTVTLEGVIKRDNGICQICKKLIDINNIANGHIGKLYPTIDHIIPISKGGGHTWVNVQLAHMCCNSGKRDRIASKVRCE